MYFRDSLKLLKMDSLPLQGDTTNLASNSLQTSWDMYKWRLFLAVGLIAFLIVLANFVGATLSVLMLLFLCGLIALGVCSISDWVEKHTPLPDKVALALTVILIVVLLVGFAFFLGARLAGEFSQLGSTLQESLRRLEEQLRQYSWGEQVLQQLPTSEQVNQQISSGGNLDLFARITGVFSSTMGFLSSVIIVIFISLFLAAQPEVYRDNFLRLVPKEKSDRICQILNQVADTLQTWLLTRFISILVIGVLTIVGLLLLNIPLALSLETLAALAGFIPTFGPILALIPAILVAFTTTPHQVVTVFLLYMGILDGRKLSRFPCCSEAYVISATRLYYRRPDAFWDRCGTFWSHSGSALGGCTRYHRPYAVC